jgi:hypothetical protein
MNLNAKVQPVVATVVIVLAVLAIMVKIWGDGRALAIGGPAQLLRAPSGNVYLQIQNQLLQHSPQGGFERRIDLSELGVTKIIGGIAFFPDGDILVRRGRDPRSLLDNVRAYGRLQSKRSILSPDPESGLARCDLESMTCAPFGVPTIDFQATFHAHINAVTDIVYVSDTSRHTLRSYSADGSELSSIATGMKFPNQLLVHDGQLLVADTNNHRIAVLEVNGMVLTQQSASIDVVPGEGESSGERWPTHFARVADRWWVNNMRSDLRNGGIYVFDDEWQFIERLQLPGGADPIAILPFGSGALISDWDNDRVYYVDASGRLLDDFTSAGLEELLSESRDRRIFYKLVSWLGIALFVLVLAGLVIKALLEPTRNARDHSAVTNPEPAAPPQDWVWFSPDQAVVNKVRFSARTALVALALLIAALLVLAVVRAQWLILIGLALPLTGLVAVSSAIYWMALALVRTRIGLRGNHVALQDHRGRESRSPLHRVVYSDSAIATPAMAVLLGGPRKSIYDRRELDENLVPHLGKATRITEWQMQLRLIRLHRPTAVVLTLVLIASLAAVGAYLLASWVLLPAGN